MPIGGNPEARPSDTPATPATATTRGRRKPRGGRRDHPRHGLADLHVLGAGVDAQVVLDEADHHLEVVGRAPATRDGRLLLRTGGRTNRWTHVGDAYFWVSCLKWYPCSSSRVMPDSCSRKSSTSAIRMLLLGAALMALEFSKASLIVWATSPSRRSSNRSSSLAWRICGRRCGVRTFWSKARPHKEVSHAEFRTHLAKKLHQLLTLQVVDARLHHGQQQAHPRVQVPFEAACDEKIMIIVILTLCTQ